MEILKGINIFDPAFYVPVLAVLLIFIIVVKIAKKLIKLAIFIGVVILAAVLYFNLPSFKVEGSTAVLKVSGQEYTIDARDVKIVSENQEGKEKVFLVSGSTKIELPFSKSFAENLILKKISQQSN